MKRKINFFTMTALLSMTLLCACNENNCINDIINQFIEIARIPRPSGHEEQISTYIYNWAKARNLDPIQDEVNNVVFDVKATKGYENLPKVALQGHLDMVFVQNPDSYLDPLTTPITVINDGTYLRAKNTSLGADNGVGVAMILKIVEGKMNHGPLRVIFTTSEESDFNGVKNIDPNVVKDLKYLISLDNAKEQEACVSSAACATISYTKDFELATPIGTVPISFEVFNLPGGHSGEDIINNPYNAIKIIGHALKILNDNNINYSLADFVGGTAFNVIPADCNATIMIEEKDIDTVISLLDECLKNDLKDEATSKTIGEYMIYTPMEIPNNVLKNEDKNLVVTFINEIKNGVYSKIEGYEIPKTSSNVGLFKLKDNKFDAGISYRSSDNDDFERDMEYFRNFGEQKSFNFSRKIVAVPWEYNENNPLISLATEIYKKIFQSDIVIAPSHGGLELGNFSQYNPDLHIICFGATINNAHSVSETCEIKSITRLWNFIKEYLISVK